MINPWDVIWWCVAVVFMIATTTFVIAVLVGLVSALYGVFLNWRDPRRRKYASRDTHIVSAPACRRCGGSGIEPAYPVENN